MMTEAWLRYQTTLALAAFVAGCTIAEMQLRLVDAALDPINSIRPPRPRIRLVSDHGILIEGSSP